MRKLRNIAAMMLSAVFLPTLLLVSLHRHQPVAEGDSSVCSECASHVPHSHLSGINHTDDCLICQFLTVVWMPSEEESAVQPAVESSEWYDASAGQAPHILFLVPSLRAPPAVFC